MSLQSKVAHNNKTKSASSVVDKITKQDSKHLLNTLGGKNSLHSIPTTTEAGDSAIQALHMSNESWDSLDCCEGVSTNAGALANQNVGIRDKMLPNYHASYEQFASYDSYDHMELSLHYYRPYEDSLPNLDDNLIALNKDSHALVDKQDNYKLKSMHNEQGCKLKSYFYHYKDEFIFDYLKNAGEQHKVAAVLAYGIFRQWMHRRRMSIVNNSHTYADSNETVFYYTAMLLIQTMVFAIRADGRVDRDEHAALVEFCAVIFNQQIKNIRGELDRMLTIELDPSSLASKVKFPEESLDMYLLSAVMLKGDHLLERSYLENLAASLGIDPSLRNNLDARAQEISKHDFDSLSLNNAYQLNNKDEISSLALLES